MVFWLSILVAIAFLSLAVKLGLYETWTILFNAAIAIYLAIVLNPIVKPLLPDEARSSFDDLVVMLFLGIGLFSMIHSLIYIFIIGQFKISSGKFFDSLGAAGLGALLGLLIFNFVIIVICGSPLAGNKVIRKIGLEREKIQPNILYVSRYADIIHSIVGTKQQESVSELLDKILRKYDKSLTKNTQASPQQTDEPKIEDTAPPLQEKIVIEPNS